MKHTIELNGRHYDVVTGALIDKPHQANSAGKQHHEVSHTSHATQPSHNTQRHSSHAVTHHQKHTRSRTLVRKGLKRPVITHSSHAKRIGNRPIVTIAQLHNDVVRISRINRIHKSKLVTRFN